MKNPVQKIIQEKKLHWLVKRFLNRIGVGEKEPPDRSQWEKFVFSVSNVLDNYDQDHYLLERSMQVSSREMRELNEKLENAQHIAHMGYWLYDRESGRQNWSNETFFLLETDPALGEPSYEDIIKKIHEADRRPLESLINRAFEKGMDYEAEFRIGSAESGYRWMFSKGHPHLEKKENPTAPIRYLSGIIMDITERKKGEEEIIEMHQKLIDTARQAGMAEVATAVLHNIGNILNSASVSLGVLKETTEKKHIQKLNAAACLVREHQGDNWLNADAKGKQIPLYLATLADVILKDHELLASEIQNLDKQLQHICDIVAMQKDISGLSGLAEKIYLPEIIEMAIQMSSIQSNNEEIEIVRQFATPIFLIADRARLLQILVNLIRNARDALYEKKEAHDNKKIIIQTLKIDQITRIRVIDTGIGIPEENLTKIFSMGYTTKPKGHGFGLHSSAIAATELGGSLYAASDGSGKGTTFTLELPCSNEVNSEGKKHVTT